MRPTKKKRKPRFAKWDTSSRRSQSKSKPPLQSWQERQKARLRHRWSENETYLRIHASAVDFARRRFADLAQSSKILENNQKPGKLKFALMDVCDEIESGATLSEAMSKSPKVFSRLYVNMIKAGEAGGALETILQRLADFLERAESLKRKVKGALIYPVIVVMVAAAILTFIMIWIVPTFEEMFEEFGLDLPAPTILLIAMANYIKDYWFLIIAMPVSFADCCQTITQVQTRPDWF